MYVQSKCTCFEGCSSTERIVFFLTEVTGRGSTGGLFKSSPLQTIGRGYHAMKAEKLITLIAIPA